MIIDEQKLPALIIYPELEFHRDNGSVSDPESAANNSLLLRSDPFILDPLSIR